MFRRIVLPLTTPALAAVALFQFVAAWNDFRGPLFYVNDVEPARRALSLQLVAALGRFYSGGCAPPPLVDRKRRGTE
ncbi:MAG: hypothetical protein KY475_24860 [Planctomycetes bacterium]|nr:hypothetical protein [Planctomycetota bacterium]